MAVEYMCRSSSCLTLVISVVLLSPRLLVVKCRGLWCRLRVGKVREVSERPSVRPSVREGSLVSSGSDFISVDSRSSSSFFGSALVGDDGDGK